MRKKPPRLKSTPLRDQRMMTLRHQVLDANRLESPKLRLVVCEWITGSYPLGDHEARLRDWMFENAITSAGWAASTPSAGLDIVLGGLFRGPAWWCGWGFPLQFGGMSPTLARRLRDGTLEAVPDPEAHALSHGWALFPAEAAGRGIEAGLEDKGSLVAKAALATRLAELSESLMEVESDDSRAWAPSIVGLIPEKSVYVLDPMSPTEKWILPELAEALSNAQAPEFPRSYVVSDYAASLLSLLDSLLASPEKPSAKKAGKRTSPYSGPEFIMKVAKARKGRVVTYEEIQVAWTKERSTPIRNIAVDAKRAVARSEGKLRMARDADNCAGVEWMDT